MSLRGDGEEVKIIKFWERRSKLLFWLLP